MKIPRLSFTSSVLAGHNEFERNCRALRSWQRANASSKENEEIRELSINIGSLRTYSGPWNLRSANDADTTTRGLLESLPGQ